MSDQCPECGCEYLEYSYAWEEPIACTECDWSKDLETCDLESCPRCGETHEGIRLYQFDQPVNIRVYDLHLTHDAWSICPVKNEPIIWREAIYGPSPLASKIRHDMDKEILESDP